MERVIKFRYRYTDGVNWKFVVCTLPEILNGKPIDEMSDNPLLKHFKHVGEDQFTGLLDKAGKEIYEGDFVECKMSYNGGFLPHMGEIVYLEKFGAFATKNLGGETLLHNHLGPSFEIIGNRYSNPELLSTPLK